MTATYPPASPGATHAHAAASDGLIERAIVEAAPDGILLVGSDGRILLANAAMADLSGYPPLQLLGQSVAVLLPPGLQDLLQESIGRRARRMDQLWLRRRDGRTVPVDVALGYSGARGGVAIAFIRDATEAYSREERMRRESLHDPLTGLLNRRGFDQRLTEALALALRQQCPAALLLLDLDGFKAINDGLGHAAGDLALRETARRLRQTLRASDTLARYGGDEFTALLPGASVGDAACVADKMLAALARPCRIRGHDIALRASIGIAHCPTHACVAHGLLHLADEAMYQAKHQGRSRHAAYAAYMADGGAAP